MFVGSMGLLLCLEMTEARSLVTSGAADGHYSAKKSADARRGEQELLRQNIEIKSESDR